MGRSTSEQATQNRTKIVEAASRLFRERGVGNVSIAQVMASVNMTNGGFYKHFASKDALVQEACAASFEQAFRSWTAMVKRGDGDAKTAVDEIVSHYFEARPADRNCPILAYAPDMAAAGASGLTEQTYLRGTETLFELLASQMREANGDRDQYPKADANAALVFAAMVGAQLLSQATNDSDWSHWLQTTVAEHASALKA